jgi:hypothetical protein
MKTPVNNEHIAHANAEVAAAHDALAAALRRQREANGEAEAEVCRACRGTKVDELAKHLRNASPDDSDPPCEECDGKGEVPRRYPIIVQRLSFRADTRVLQPNLFGRSGWVAVRPCSDDAEGKTFLGYLLGDLAQSASVSLTRDGTLNIGFGAHNPAMFVPDLGRVVMGYESWWSQIKTEADLRQITDADITNVWYVKALAALREVGL